MHFFPDTSDADSAAETFWPEGYKQVIREDFRKAVRPRISGSYLERAYHRNYSQEYSNPDELTDRIADMVTIGAENGTDIAFDNIYSAFLTESPMPELRGYARPLLPQAVRGDVERKITDTVIADFSGEKVYRHAYKVGYSGDFAGFEEFIQRVAALVVAGARLGSDDMMAAINKSLIRGLPLPPARRNPRRLRSW
jgi:hypothetical protein